MGHDLTKIEHFAMPTQNIPTLERFVRDILGGVPYYYAGYDEVDRQMGRKSHILVRFGDVLFRCTEEGGSIESGRLDALVNHLKQNGIPVAGPIAQPQFGGQSVYFEAPEAHKLEVFEQEPQHAHGVGDEASIGR